MQVNEKSDFRDAELTWLLGIVLVACIGWVRNPAAYFADDSYFYCVIARNLVRSGEQTFSGLFPTNGFHPLWLWLMTGWAWVTNSVFGPEALRDEMYCLPIAVFFLIGGTFQWWRISKKFGQDSIILCGIPPLFLGAFGVLGSEAHLQYFVTSCLLYAWVVDFGATNRQACVLGAIAGLMVLARLDLIFLAAVAAFYSLSGWRSLARTGSFVAGGALVVGPYLVCNHWMYGGFMPISGWIKSDFPRPHFSGLAFEGGLNISLSEYNVIFGWLPIVLSFLCLGTWRSENSPPIRLLRLLATASLMHLSYTSFFAATSCWYWYYVLPVTAGALSVSIALSRMQWMRWIHPACACLFLFCLAAGVSMTKPNREIPLTSAQRASLEFLNRLHLDDQTVLVSDYPGYLAFHSRANVIAADMLTANIDFYKAMRESPDAFAFLREYCNKEHAPLRFALFLGNSWLVPTADMSTLTYRDPKEHQQHVEIGRISLGQPAMKAQSGDFWAWKFP